MKKQFFALILSVALSLIAFVLVAMGAVAQAQQPTNVPRIGYLSS